MFIENKIGKSCRNVGVCTFLCVAINYPNTLFYVTLSPIYVSVSASKEFFNQLLLQWNKDTFSTKAKSPSCMCSDCTMKGQSKNIKWYSVL